VEKPRKHPSMVVVLLANLDAALANARPDSETPAGVRAALAIAGLDGVHLVRFVVAIGCVCLQRREVRGRMTRAYCDEVSRFMSSYASRLDTLDRAPNHDLIWAEWQSASARWSTIATQAKTRDRDAHHESTMIQAQGF
jgi:hypothetical protein